MGTGADMPSAIVKPYIDELNRVKARLATADDHRKALMTESENSLATLVQLAKENEKLKGQVQWHVDKVAEGYFGGPGLKGYEELGEKCAELHNAWDEEKMNHAKTAKQLVDAQAVEGCTQKKFEELEANVRRLQDHSAYIKMVEQNRDLKEQLDIMTADRDNTVAETRAAEACAKDLKERYLHQSELANDRYEQIQALEKEFILLKTVLETMTYEVQQGCKKLGIT